MDLDLLKEQLLLNLLDLNLREDRDYLECEHLLE